MGLDRRNFLKTLGVVGTTLAVGKSLAAERRKVTDVEFKAVLFDATRCTGCQNCEFACAEANGLPEPTDTALVGKLRKTNENRRTVHNVYKTSKGEVYVKNQCMHCNEPACAAACLTMAMYKTKEGPVIWRGDKCMGCRYCMVSCPFDIPKFEYHSPNPKIQKCTMCYEKIKTGKLPACVDICPSDALKFGTRRDLVNEAQKRIVENPDKYYNHIYGEIEAGGTGFLYLSPVPYEELGMKTNLQNSSYPELSKGFLYTVPSVFVLLPPLLLGIHEATKNNNHDEEDHETLNP